MDEKSKTKLSRRTVLKGAAAAAAVDERVQHQSRLVEGRGLGRQAVRRRRRRRCASPNGAVSGKSRSANICCPTSRRTTIARSPGIPAFPWFPKFSAGGPKAPFCDVANWNLEGHVPDRARGRLLPAARRRAAQHPQRRQPLGFRQGHRPRHHLGLWTLHLRLPHRPDRRAHQEASRTSGGRRWPASAAPTSPSTSCR